MPISKRLKECIKAYPDLLADYRAKGQAFHLARAEYEKARLRLNEKVAEALAELDSCIPPDVDKVPRERVLEVEGKYYVLTHRPADMNVDTPGYIREIIIER